MRSKPKDDCLQREQLPVWFDAMRKIDNHVISAYLQALLLTGARREELLTLRWQDVDFKWKSLTIRDKVEGQRTIPLTPYVSSLLRDLKRRNQKPTVRHLRKAGATMSSLHLHGYSSAAHPQMGDWQIRGLHTCKRWKAPVFLT